MGQILHGSVRTTEAVRRAVQQSRESISKLSECYHLHPKTVAKWKKRTHVHDAPMGPKQPRSRILTLEEEEVFCPTPRKGIFQGRSNRHELGSDRDRATQACSYVAEISGGYSS
jgi:hypothetical protein